MDEDDFWDGFEQHVLSQQALFEDDASTRLGLIERNRPSQGKARYASHRFVVGGEPERGEILLLRANLIRSGRQALDIVRSILEFQDSWTEDLKQVQKRSWRCSSCETWWHKGGPTTS